MRQSLGRAKAGEAGDKAGFVTSRRHKPDYQIMLFMGLIMLFGLVVMYAIGPQRSNFLNIVEGTDFYTSSYFFVKQAISLFAAAIMFALAATIPYKTLFKHAGKIFGLAVGAAIVLFLLGNVLNVEQLTLCTKGACRWFVIPGFGTFQPAELMKFGVLIFVAGFLGMRARQGLINNVDKTLIPLSIITAVAMLFVIVIQKDMGTGLALLAILVAMLVAANIKYKILGIIAAILVAASMLLIVTAPHRIARVVTFFQGDSASVEDAGGYHIAHAKIAIGSGGLTGVGIGNSVQASGYLPESINDSVFAIMGETFGFVGLVVIILLFMALLLRLLHVADHLEDMRLRLVVVGVFGWLAAHVMLNIAAMIGIFPLTGITLPLLSFGGTSMIFIAAALGLAFQLSRYTNFSHRAKEQVDEDSRSRRGVGRTRYAGRRSY